MHVAWMAGLPVVNICVRPEVGDRHFLVPEPTPASAAVCCHTKLADVLPRVLIESHVWTRL